MLKFEKLSLKQIKIFSKIIAKTTLKEREFIKEKYLKMSSNFEDTVEFLNMIGLIVTRRNRISPRPLYQSILKKEKEIEKFLVEKFIVQKNPLTEYLFEFFSLFRLINKRYEFKPNTAQRLKYSGLRNFLIDLGFLFYDSAHKKYIISDEYFPVYSELRKRDQLSLDKFLKILQKQDKISKAAELEIIRYEKNRLSKFPHLAKKVEHISEKNVLAGYDIKSFTEKDEKNISPSPRYIEVKAISLRKHRFFWTRNEIESSKLYRQNYYLYLVPVLSITRFDLNNIIMIKNPYLNVYKNKNNWLRKVELIEFSYRKTSVKKNGPNSKISTY